MNTYREEDAIHIHIILYLCILVCLGVRDDGVMALNQKQRAEEFIDRWRGRGDEKQETQLFWLDLMQNVLGLQHTIESTKFEYKTAGNGFIDVLCPDARFLVEQKSSDIDLDKPEPRQGTMVTPVQRAVRYSDNLPLSLKPSKICVCNFQRFRLYDLEADPRAKGEPADDFALEDLFDHLGNLISVFGKDDSRIMHEQHLSEHAGLLVANLHNALTAQYADPDAPQSHHSLAVLTVRLVFCLYAEDAGLFKPNAFSQYIESYDAAHLRRAVIDLFHVLNTKFEDRDQYLGNELKAFPYVNGGLFANPIEIPQFTDVIRDSLLAAGKGFNWRQISPVIFGSLMEETLSHDQRCQGGMHYTTVKNIHRVIDPLFLDDLSAELDRIEKDRTIGDKARSHRLRDYQDKLAGLRFLERNFISFLYFYHLVRSSQSRTEEKPKIVVIDDPMSSMDSSTLYIVGFLVREMIEVCHNNTDYKGDTELGDNIKQIFILTHNVYFHSEITYKQEKNFRSTSFFKILKTNNTSSAAPFVWPDSKRPSEDENYNPIQNFYKALWAELKETKTAIPALNVIRQILEYFFMQMCGYDRKELRQRVLEGDHKDLFMEPAPEDGRPDLNKYHLADSLLRYISNPTGFGSEIHLMRITPTRSHISMCSSLSSKQWNRASITE